MTPAVNYAIYGCAYTRTTPGVSLYRSIKLEENIVAAITQDRMIDDNLKRQIKNQHLGSYRLFPANICWSWRRFQNVFTVTILRLPRHLKDILKTSWKTKKCYAEDVLKTSSWHLGDKQNFCWEYLYLTSLNLYLINLYLTYLYLTNQGESKMHPLEPNSFNIFLILKLKHFLFWELKSLTTVWLLWN